jgi:hypothetical protein
MIRFCTFGSVPAYAPALQTLANEAHASGYFDEVVAFTQHDLGLTPERLAWMELTRGYGYWTWKYMVILRMFERCGPDDIVVYADAGCGISTSPAARETWQRWCTAVREHPTHRLAFQMPHPEEDYTKRDVFEILCATGDEFTKSGQLMATLQLYKATPENRAFVNRCLQICTMMKYHYVNDDPSLISNAPTFKVHRHDQSIWSVLLKQHGCAILPDHWKDPDSPIMALRRRRG